MTQSFGTADEKADYFNEDFEIVERSFADDLHNYHIQINEKLETALAEIQDLQSQLPAEQNKTLLELCKINAIETVTSQFGLASLFITAQDGGSVTTTHNFEKGITANERDQQAYQNMQNNQSKDWQEVRKQSGYEKDFPKRRKQDFQNNDKIYDAYTGKELPKDKSTQLDHIVPVKEIEQNSAAHLFLSEEERAAMATDPKNTAYTNNSINQSKGEQSMEDFLDKKVKGQAKNNAERFDIDKEKAKQADKIARQHIESTIDLATFKKYSTEVLATGGKDAVKMLGTQTIGMIFREIIQGTMIELRATFDNKGSESLKDIFVRFKQRIQKIWHDLKENLGSILKGSIGSGITAFFSNIVVFVINLFATTLKRIVSMIRAGFVSLVQAVKILVNPPVDMPKEEVHYQALKILTTGLIGALSLGLTAAIDNLLKPIPGMQLPVPFSDGRTVSDAIAVTVSALIGGILSTIALYWMDKLRSQAKEDKIKIQLLTKTGLVAEYKLAQTWCVLGEAYEQTIEKFKQTSKIVQTNHQQMKEKSSQTQRFLDETGDMANSVLELPFFQP